MKKVFLVFLAAAMLALAPAAFGGELPRLSVSYIFTTHQEPFMVALARGEAFADSGVYLKPVVAKEKYDLMVEGNAVARLSVIVAKSGAETSTLFAQKHLDIGLGSLPAMMTAIDKGLPIKVLCPVHTEGMGLVVAPANPVSDWNSFLAWVKGAKQPVKLGYHSPTSAPRIVIEGALREAGLAVTEDPGDVKAQVLLVDLKETSNLIMALTSGQVDAWVGPDPIPAVAVEKKAGKLVMDLKDLPPAGRWSNFPCCVAAARTEILEAHPAETAALVDLLTKSAAWINANKSEAATITAEWLGMPREAIERSTIVFGTDPTEGWIRGAGAYLDVLNAMNKLSGSLKGKKIEDVQGILFDFSHVRK